MLRWAGLGVAIGGAVPEVLEVADLVAPPLEEDGAAQVLEDLLRRGLIG
jgi:hydroxymethylpyrimidine pyrophosphatase-like HAD family hydrolase